MKMYCAQLLFILLLASFNSYAQESITVAISGVVTHVESGKPLSDVTVQVKGTVTGAVTNNEGAFSLKTKAPPTVYHYI